MTRQEDFSSVHRVLQIRALPMGERCQGNDTLCFAKLVLVVVMTVRQALASGTRCLKNFCRMLWKFATNDTDLRAQTPEICLKCLVDATQTRIVAENSHADTPPAC